MALVMLFPGQGAQTVGMGKDVADVYPAARQVFAEVDEALGEHLSALIWEGDQELLNLTVNAQPALMATSIAVFRALAEEGFDLDSVSFFAGHSLGEYTALCAAGCFTLAETACLLRERGRAMQTAVPVGEGAMAALLGLPINAVEDIARQASAEGVCEVANDNDPKQVVVSGEVAPVELAIRIASANGARRAVKLPTSAPFHCSLMETAAARMESVLSEVKIRPPNRTVIANVTACPTAAETVRQLLVQQVTGRVRWRESILWMADNGVSQALEVGAGTALSGMVRRTSPKISCSQCGKPKQIQDFVRLLETRDV